jgi:hypothetical protein
MFSETEIVAISSAFVLLLSEILAIVPEKYVKSNGVLHLMVSLCRTGLKNVKDNKH